MYQNLIGLGVCIQVLNYRKEVGDVYVECCYLDTFYQGENQRKKEKRIS